MSFEVSESDVAVSESGGQRVSEFVGFGVSESGGQRVSESEHLFPNPPLKFPNPAGGEFPNPRAWEFPNHGPGSFRIRR